MMNGKQPKISILIPSLNVEKYVTQCIDSIINQTLSDIEIICIDAGSTDGTLDILTEYEKKDSRVKLVKSSKKSYGYQMNLGLTLATGEYVGIVETDDYVSENMYECLYCLTENGTIDVVKGTFFHVYDYDLENPLVIDWSKNELKNVKTPFALYQQERFIDGHPSIWAGIYRRDFLIENNIKFIEEVGGGWVDNGFFFETSCAANKIVYCPEPYYYYYREDNPNSSSNSLGDFTIPIRRMIENLEILNKYNCNDENVLHMAYLRVFAYLNNIFRRDGYEEHMDELMPYINKMMLMLDENVVLNKLKPDLQKEYYKYLFLNDFNVDFDDYESWKNFTNISEDYALLKSSYSKKCNEFNKIKSERDNLNNIKEEYFKKCDEVDRLNLENKELIFKKNKLHKYINVVENSKAFKLSMFFASPIRKLKNLINKKKNLNVLFMPSDNNRTSGAFLSMANLIVNLKNKYGINELVILPNDGNGDEILSSFGINFKFIESRDWVVPLSQKHDDKFYREVSNKKKVNENAIIEIRKIIEENNFDIMHINTTYSYVGAKAAIEENLPFVWHLREFLEEDQNNTLWDRDEGNKLINKANRIIAISDSIFKKYESIFDNGKLVRIFNGIDATKFYKPHKTIFNEDIIKFIMVGGFEYYKGQIEFAKACAELYTSGFHDFDVSFIGTGRGDVKEEVEKIISDAGMDNVKYLGYKNNVEDYFDKADVSFTCAKSEAFGRTTVEAMLSGNIVIGADSAGTNELISEGITGILYKHGNSHDLYEKMKYVIENKDISKNIANNGRRFMYENMTAEINADNIYSLYNQVISEK